MNETLIKEQPHSVKFAVNAKGQWSSEVKVYADTPENAFTKALELGQKIDLFIRGKNGLE